jgi:hypothetical protein
VQVLDGVNTETVLWLVYAVIVTEVVAPTVAEAVTGVGVRVTSVFPAVAARVPTEGARTVHCGYKVRSAYKVREAPPAYVVPVPSDAVFQFLKENPVLAKVLALNENAVPAVKEVFAIDPLVTVLVS